MPRVLLILALLVTVARAQETVQPEAAGLSAEGLSLVDAAFEKMVERKGVAGAVVLVARNDKVGYFEVFGEQAPGQPMRKDTIFRIYSMSKPVTSVAALILVEEGKLALDDPVTKYVPVLAGVKVQGKQENEGIPQRTATVKDLLLHTAGFSYGFGIGPVDGRYRQAKLLESKDLKKMMRKLSALPLVREPGTQWHYSVGTDVLGRVIEVASGQALDRFLQERVFGPLGMRDTGFSVPKEKLPRFAANYGPAAQGELRLVDAPATSRFGGTVTLFSGGGGLVSTAADYLRFCRMLERGGELDQKRILKRETVAMMTGNQLPEALVPISMGAFKMPGTGFGLGFAVRMAEKPAQEHGEYGWAGAASTGFSIAPAADLIVITMVQYMPFNGRFHRTAKGLAYKAVLKPEPSAARD